MLCCQINVYSYRNGIVRYNPVMKLKVGLDKLNKVKGLTQAEEGECRGAEEER